MAASLRAFGKRTESGELVAFGVLQPISGYVANGSLRPCLELPAFT